MLNAMHLLLIPSKVSPHYIYLPDVIFEHLNVHEYIHFSLLLNRCQALQVLDECRLISASRLPRLGMSVAAEELGHREHQLKRRIRYVNGDGSCHTIQTPLPEVAPMTCSASGDNGVQP